MGFIPASSRFAGAFLLGATALGVAACNSGTNAQPQIPLTVVNEVLFLTDQQNSALRFDNGAVYHKGGLRGLIVVRQNAGTYLAFDRTCPYQPQDTCARVRIEPFIRIFDSCCQSQFGFTGQPQGGPATLPLRRYSTALSGNTLTITN
ncbi:Rieske (2Fe-2S) protein [Hymenobacter psychrophilus]|uniref:Rieske domain-containing protein n=1 Tax=Hymenobacter psychrophilus TaxID=651662 RepID=A0A1H3HMM1_9BACT|nr:hypothetical protein [Hymenobacter psychrophilus]SDY16034.1 hypothetical protein SAMN04488069_10637 [Hymenobacter psychrophilus]